MLISFGTDGIRGVANSELTPEVALAFGRATSRVLGAKQLLIGRDTRISGPMLQAAMSAGVASEGVDVKDVGVIPTPGLAWLSSSTGLPAAMISASHNSFQDNGIKVFEAGGTKLSDHAEDRIEAELHKLLGPGPRGAPREGSRQVGRVESDPTATAGYERHLLSVLEGRGIAGLKVVLDCASGAASRIAPEVFRSAGAEISVIGNRPDGTNINDACGSTHPESLQSAVVAEGADAGLAFDGDADRVLAVDGEGNLVDGDHLLAMFAADLAGRGQLRGNGVVVTVMTNLGFRMAMQGHGIEVTQVQVGDRYVLEALEASGLVLGGEQSGHIIFRDLATTGDGLLTGLLLLDLVVRGGRSLAELARGTMQRLPQVLLNVEVGDKAALEDASAVWAEVADVERELAENGRVLLRASGTEALVRVMVEASSPGVAQASAERLTRVVRRELGGSGA